MRACLSNGVIYLPVNDFFIYFFNLQLNHHLKKKKARHLILLIDLMDMLLIKLVCDIPNRNTKKKKEMYNYKLKINE